MHPSDCALMIPSYVWHNRGSDWHALVMSADSPIGNWTRNAGSNPADLFGTRLMPNRISNVERAREGRVVGEKEQCSSETACCSSLSIHSLTTQSIRVHSIF